MFIQITRDQQSRGIDAALAYIEEDIISLEDFEDIEYFLGELHSGALDPAARFFGGLETHPREVAWEIYKGIQ